MTLFISRKDTFKSSNEALHVSCIQIEHWANQTENHLGIQQTTPGGSYTDVAVGGLVSFKTGPAANTNYSATTTIFTDAVTLVQGHQYSVTLSGYGQQITNASAQAIVFCTDSSALITGGNSNTLRGLDGALALSEPIAGSNTTVVSPASTVVDTFTVSAFSNSASLTVFAHSAQLTIVRVA
jgi:hypothetical protein